MHKLNLQNKFKNRKRQLEEYEYRNISPISNLTNVPSVPVHFVSDQR